MILDQETVDARASKPDTRRRVLIVVDEPDLAATCLRFLLKLGYAPRTVQSLTEALPLIEAERPDLIVADVPRPGGLDGPAILRRIRDRGWRIPVILCTGRPLVLSRHQALEAGAAGYLTKPFSLAELGAVIARTFAGPSFRAGADASDPPPAAPRP